jgi:hypothetical protein
MNSQKTKTLLFSLILFVNGILCFSKQITEVQSLEIAQQFYTELNTTEQCSL